MMIDTCLNSLKASLPMEDAGPWKLILRTGVGGAFAAGFVRDKEELLVVSSNGQAIFDCLSGERIYRNREDDGFDFEQLEAVRLNDPDQVRVPMAGGYGGGLRSGTNDGWTIDTLQLQWPTAYSILQPPNASIYYLNPYWSASGENASYHLVMKSEGLPVVFGFSWSGKTLIWMESCDLHIWSRDV